MTALAVDDVVRTKIYLHPGHSAISREPALVTTILGSCVSVCLWDERVRIGGITHYLLPRPIAGGGDAARFGSTAIRHVVAEMTRGGATKLVAKVFGGSSMSSALAASGRDLGSQNVAIAVEELRALSIPVIASDTGGGVGRKLLFQTDDGTAWVKLLERR